VFLPFLPYNHGSRLPCSILSSRGANERPSQTIGEADLPFPKNRLTQAALAEKPAPGRAFSTETIPSRHKNCWWARQDLNLGPTDYESAALTS
jgi:hypothetical protein